MKPLISFSSAFYQNVLRPGLFRFDSERVHGWLTSLGEAIGRTSAKNILAVALCVEDPRLEQIIHGVPFPNPIGLAAGFDYEARLTQVLPSIGFGFGTIGTITSQPYEGNEYPRLGRLIKSRSLFVNKGFKNHGIHKTLAKLSDYKFQIPIGISIGKTNTSGPETQAEAVKDIVSAFREAIASPAPFGYYELNVSCPNLSGNISFYPPENLRELLRAVLTLPLRKPLFIKMPIEKNDKEILGMLKVIASFPVQGVIFGNLQRNRQDPALHPEETAKYPAGNFSGKPTEKRSNELIRLAYARFGKKLTIIGCGGVFSAEDAYRKIRLGASLVELITGLVYMGPQLPAEINAGLLTLLKKDGFSHISEAVGADNGSASSP